MTVARFPLFPAGKLVSLSDGTQYYQENVRCTQVAALVSAAAEPLKALAAGEPVLSCVAAYLLSSLIGLSASRFSNRELSKEKPLVIPPYLITLITSYATSCVLTRLLTSK